MQAVRDIDDAHPLALERADQLEQFLHVVLLERLGRLIEEENLRPGRERPRDLNHVALGEREIDNAALDRHLQRLGRNARNQATRFSRTIGAAERRRRELQVLEHGEVGRERRALIGNREAERAH